MTNGPVPGLEPGLGDSGDDTDGSLPISSSIQPPPGGQKKVRDGLGPVRLISNKR
jgi:hypothetical protein